MAETKELIAYCGLYCGDCPNHKGEIADLARDLRKKLREAKFDRTAQGLSKYFKEFRNYEQCYQVLGGMVRLRCKRTCRSGGGNPACKVRSCCTKRGIGGCWECQEFETCQNLRKLKKQGTEAFIAGTRYW
jgi:hypothetical protein